MRPGLPSFQNVRQTRHARFGCDDAFILVVIRRSDDVLVDAVAPRKHRVDGLVGGGRIRKRQRQRMKRRLREQRDCFRDDHAVGQRRLICDLLRRLLLDREIDVGKCFKRRDHAIFFGLN